MNDSITIEKTNYFTIQFKGKGKIVLSQEELFELHDSINKLLGSEAESIEKIIENEIDKIDDILKSSKPQEV